MTLNTFLNFGGNCESALTFYAEHLGGALTMMMRRGELPAPADTWPGWEQSIQYAVLNIGETQLMASDVPPARFQPMCSVYLSLTFESAAEAEQVSGATLRRRRHLHAPGGDVLRDQVRAAAA